MGFCYWKFGTISQLEIVIPEMENLGNKAVLYTKQLPTESGQLEISFMNLCTVLYMNLNDYNSQHEYS